MPTATELAAVRARVDALESRATHRTKARTVLVRVVGAVVVAVVVALLTGDLLSGGRPGTSSTWALTLGLGTRTGFSVAGLVRQRRLDAAVRARLAVDGPARTVGRRPALPLGPVGGTVAVCGLLGSVGLVLGVVAALPSVLREAGVAAVLPVLSLLGVLVLAAAAGIHVLRSAPVGAGPVLEAVDGSVRKHRLLEVLEPIPMFAFIATVQLGLHPTRYEGALGLCALAAVLATLGASAGRMHEPLFKDYRLVTAREPEAWLAGEPA